MTKRGLQINSSIAIADSTNGRRRAYLDHLPKGDPANAVKLLAAAGVIALAPEAIGLLGQLTTRAAASCAANPVLCVNEVTIWAADAGMSNKKGTDLFNLINLSPFVYRYPKIQLNVFTVGD